MNGLGRKIFREQMSIEIRDQLLINHLQFNITEKVWEVAINPIDVSLNGRFFKLFNIFLFVNPIGEQIINVKLFSRGNGFTLNGSELLFELVEFTFAFGLRFGGANFSTGFTVIVVTIVI